MKDFAKSIRVGNGYNGSENLTQSEYEATQKVLKRWESEKKSAEETVKKYEKMLADNPTASGWKAILEGAKSRIKEADSNIAQLKKELGNRKVGNAESMIEKEIKIIYEANGKDREKAKEYISKKYPSIARTGQLDRILDEVAGVPARSKNESIDKQEWSMFQGLKEDAEKEIGNADTVSEYNSEIQRLTKKAEQLRRMGQGKSAMEIEKQIEKLGKELSELGNKKTGNEETKAERKFGKVMGEFEEGALKTPQGKTVTDPSQAKAIAYSEADKVDNLKRDRNAMNKKTGNSKKEYSGKYIDIYDSGEVVVKEGWAFGERFNKSNFGSWINNEIQAKEKTLQECKKMKAEFEKNFI